MCFYDELFSGKSCYLLNIVLWILKEEYYSCYFDKNFWCLIKYKAIRIDVWADSKFLETLRTINLICDLKIITESFQ